MREIFKQVTNNLVTQLKEIEAGEAPAQWFKPWSMSGKPQMPTNLLTGKPYRGINAFCLYMVALGEGFRTNQWLTFKQKNTYNSAQDVDMRIVKGEHGSLIFKYVEWVPKDYIPNKGGGGYINQRTGEFKDDPKAIALRSYTVFNVDQMDGIPECILPADKPVTIEERLYEAEMFARTLACPTKSGADKAYYQPGKHFIMMPYRNAFKTLEDYYATLFHEHVHSTGPALERDMKGEMGSESYAKEELVAEIGSALLCAQFGIAAPMQHPQYIRSYIKQLEDHDRAFWTAANQAQKAIEFLTSKGEG